MSISWGAQYPKLKTNLRLSINRLKMMGKKKTEMAMKARTEIADYITAHKDDRARIRVEHIIREDYMVEAYEILEMYCDLLLARFGLIEQMKTLDDGLAEAVISILWAAPRIACDIGEFKVISDQLSVKYGKPFAEAARGNQLEYPAKVNPRLIQKLSVTAPPKLLVERYLILISECAGISYTPDPDVMREDEVAQAEKMLIDFKTAGEASNNHQAPPSADGSSGYGWSLPPVPPGAPGSNGPPGSGSGGFPSVPGGGGMPPPPGNSNYPPGPGSGSSGGGYPGSGNSGGGGGGGGMAVPPPNYGGGDDNFYDEADGHIYEVPSNVRPPPQYDQVPGDYATPTPTNYGAPFELPKIGPNGLPITPGYGPSSDTYPILSQRNSLIDEKAKPPTNSGPSAPPQSLKKPEDFGSDIAFPEPPTSFNNGGGNTNNTGGGSGGGGVNDLDFDELAKRFDQLKKKH